jgi:putative DNA primase/helicase
MGNLHHFHPATMMPDPRRTPHSFSLVSAVKLIVSAPDGLQDITRHRECYSIGGLIAGGYLEYEPTLQALTEAAMAMPTYDKSKPWRNVDKLVHKSVKRGMGRPRTLPEDVPIPPYTDEEFEALLRLMERDGAEAESAKTETANETKTKTKTENSYGGARPGAGRPPNDKPPPPPRPPPPPEAEYAVLVCAADIPMRATDWLWEGHIAVGALELLTGLPGLGKSQLQISLIASITNKLDWPNGDKAVRQGKVIMLTAEDVLDQTVIPRLVAAKVDLSQVQILKCIRKNNRNEQFLLAEDLDKVERAISRLGDVALITLDPITAYMGGRIDSHKATEVRSQLGPLKDFAERTNVAVSAITHPPKRASNTKALDQFIGSQAFIAAARIGHQSVPEMKEDDEGASKPTGRVYFTNVKPAPQHVRMPTLAYRVAPAVVGADPETGEVVTSPYVVWDLGDIDLSPDQAIAAANGTGNSRVATVRKTEKFLEKLLANGPVDSKVVVRQGAKAGFS